MPVTLHSRLPVADSVRDLLYASVGPGTLSSAYPGGHFLSEAHVARRIAYLDRSRPASSAVPPLSVRELLEAENAFAPLTPEQAANLEAAGTESALFLLTGQQPGLFGGPVLWYYKALTCAALAREWSARLERPVIPVFWVAGDDSDLRECNHLELLDPRSQQVDGELALSFPDPSRPLAVSERTLDAAGLDRLLGKLARIWDPEIIEGIRTCYPEGSTLTQGFLRLAQTHLGGEGVLFLDGYSPRLRAQARPVLEAAVRDGAAFQADLEQGTSRLASAGVEAQVALREGVVHAFALRDGERHRLLTEGAPSGRPRLYTADQPSRDLLPGLGALELTHDVFTRPLVAETVFPVLGHVLGPAELRYFGQMAPAFLRLTGDMPLLHPRMSAAVIPASAEAAFRAEGWALSSAVSLRPAALRERLVEKAWRDNPAAAELSLAPLEAWLEELRRVHDRHFPDPGSRNRFEKTLRAAWRRYQRSLKRRAFAASGAGDAGLFSHLQWLGNGSGQDRHLNIHSLRSALGRQGMEDLRKFADPAGADVQIFIFEDGDVSKEDEHG